MNQYCSTHGVNSNHGSSKKVADKPCKNPGKDHNPMATYRDRMGGNTKNLMLYGKSKDWKNNYYNTRHGK